MEFLTIVRGFFTSVNYWDWKYLFLNTIFTLLIPYAIITGALFSFTKALLKKMITGLFVFGFLVIPLTIRIDFDRELFPRGLMVTSCFFILVIPYVKPKWKLVITAVAVTSVLIAYDFRTNVLRIVFAFMVVALYYMRNYITTGLLKAGCIVLFVLPPIFLILGITGQYNIFKPSIDTDKLEYTYENGVESNPALDTRTFLYQEVLASMQANNSFLLGEGANGKYKTAYFDENVDQTKGRYSSEVGFLNTLLYSGVLGVLLYALVLISAVYYGLSHSNNFFCKMLAILLAFRWIIFFIEDFIQYDMNYFFIWLTIGLCFSREFRAMSDADIKAYFTYPVRRTIAPQLF